MKGIEKGALRTSVPSLFFNITCVWNPYLRQAAFRYIVEFHVWPSPDMFTKPSIKYDAHIKAVRSAFCNWVYRCSSLRCHHPAFDKPTT